jgi:hypothetical protein
MNEVEVSVKQLFIGLNFFDYFYNNLKYLLSHGVVAQMVERLFSIQEARGSIPLCSIFYTIFNFFLLNLIIFQSILEKSLKKGIFLILF